MSRAKQADERGFEIRNSQFLEPLAPSVELRVYCEWEAATVRCFWIGVLGFSEAPKRTCQRWNTGTGHKPIRR